MPRLKCAVQRHAIARLRAVALPVPHAMREVHDRALRHLDRHAALGRFARLRRAAHAMAAGDDPGRPRRDGPVFQRPHADAGHRKLRIRLRHVRVVGVHRDHAGSRSLA